MAGPYGLTRAALLTDGASCVVDRYGVTDWSGLLDALDAYGPHYVVELARKAEQADPNGFQRPRPKPHDDAMIAYWRSPPEVHP
jgi:hypothetical protein